MNNESEPHKTIGTNNRTMLILAIVLMGAVLTIGSITTLGNWGNFSTGVQTPLVNATYIYDKNSVEYWGAIGDGTTDDTAALQSCINAMTTCKLGEKTYAFRNLSYPASPFIGFEGISPGKSKLKGIAGISPMIRPANPTAASSGGYYWRNLQIYNTTSNNSQTCLEVNSSSFNMDYVLINTCGNAIDVTNMDYSTWNAVQAFGSQYGVFFNPNRSVNLNTFNNLHTIGTAKWGLYIQKGVGAAISNAFINPSADSSANGIFNGVSTRTTFINSYTEALTGYYSLDNEDNSGGTVFVNHYNVDGEASKVSNYNSSVIIRPNSIAFGCDGKNSTFCNFFAYNSGGNPAMYVYSDYNLTPDPIYGNSPHVAIQWTRAGVVTFPNGHS